MKTLLSILFSGLFFLSAQAQDFEKYEQMDAVDGMLITKHMFSLLANVKVEDEETQQFVSFVKDLTEVKVLSTFDENIGASMLKDMKLYIQNNQLDTLMRIKRGTKQLQFYAAPGKENNRVSELVMVMIGGHSKHRHHSDKPHPDKHHPDKLHYVLLSIEGNINLDEVGQIASALHNVPGARALKHLTPKKEHSK